MVSQPGEKTANHELLHPRNLHQGRYDLVSLSKTCPELKDYLKPNPEGDKTIDFSDNQAVLCLNKALLVHYYHVDNWSIPPGYLCPAIPGRADYIHYLADLLAVCDQGRIPTGKQVNVLDIGTGANCIYPLIGNQSYGWQFVATETDSVAVKSARLIVQSNACLSKLIKLVQQNDRQAIFKGIIQDKDRFDLTLCNPPFHSSMAEAQASSQRKRHNLSKDGSIKGSEKRNFSGQEAELCCPGGEINFLKKMARESINFSKQVCWFTSLVSKSDNIRPLKRQLSQLGVKQLEVITMRQGQKRSRLIAWSFFTADHQKSWAQERWK